MWLAVKNMRKKVRLDAKNRNQNSEIEFGFEDILLYVTLVHKGQT